MHFLRSRWTITLLLLALVAGVIIVLPRALNLLEGLGGGSSYSQGWPSKIVGPDCQTLGQERQMTPQEIKHVCDAIRS